MVEAFQYLQDLEQRCQQHAVGLPSEVDIEDDWVGIGFMSNGVKCLAKMSDVAEILPTPEAIRIPGVKHWVLGLANIRGSLIPLIDLHGFLFQENTQPSKKNRILVVNQAGDQTGILVEEVFGLRRFKQDEIQSEVDLSQLFAPLQHFIGGSFSEQEVIWQVFKIRDLAASDAFLSVVNE